MNIFPKKNYNNEYHSNSTPYLSRQDNFSFDFDVKFDTRPSRHVSVKGKSPCRPVGRGNWIKSKKERETLPGGSTCSTPTSLRSGCGVIESELRYLTALVTKRVWVKKRRLSQGHLDPSGSGAGSTGLTKIE